MSCCKTQTRNVLLIIIHKNFIGPIIEYTGPKRINYASFLKIHIVNTWGYIPNFLKITGFNFH